MRHASPVMQLFGQTYPENCRQKFDIKFHSLVAFRTPLSASASLVALRRSVVVHRIFHMASREPAALKSFNQRNEVPDSPTIHVSVIQTGRSPAFSIVEKIIAEDGFWSEADANQQILTMTGNDVSSMLRFKSEGYKSDSFLVALGVDRNDFSRCDFNVVTTQLRRPEP
ncbi:unnamed protein product [Sphagnum balticum]